jgi:hypothetical protein
MAALARETFTMASRDLQRNGIALSAKGAVSLVAWGNAPGFVETKKTH